ncbi:eukaryotic translation initiation factor 4E-binding protein [Toxorhynchites rutilus septentrionalis]|uniref:eukaryotic translation initiation factor 4E-binding protein n=1 Tax=Toxorhynchites rutilus septentrionalis TaxID=329112 RepID=UPI00247A018D|nr:eukaryotic translation initiation factor 4E-binding protein [Toxorhynchites rutilus septentrionalis]
MSASPIARQACSHMQAIPSKRVLIHDASELPAYYSSTPGGTMYSTTPGGTRIVYERAFLMNLKNSPLARTPPSNLSNLPHNILRNSPNRSASKPKTQQQSHNSPPKYDDHQEQFDMDL